MRVGDEPGPAPERLDVWRVSVLHAAQHAGDIGWTHLLRSAHVPYITVTFDEIVNDLVTVVTRVAGLVGQQVSASAVTLPDFLAQADHDTERFVDEWAAATRGCRECETDTAL
jgi:LPS sulfotransferase NodH